jgi:hypothetical protein
VAAFGLHARLLVGPRVPVEALLPAGAPRSALAGALSSLAVSLSLDGRPVASAAAPTRSTGRCRRSASWSTRSPRNPAWRRWPPARSSPPAP